MICGIKDVGSTCGDLGEGTGGVHGRDLGIGDRQDLWEQLEE